MKIIKYCKALADETRARLVNVLLEYELNVGETRSEERRVGKEC